MLPLATTSAYATITTAPVVTFSGSVGTLPASTATVTVQAQLALNVNSSGVPQQLEEVPVASATITSPLSRSRFPILHRCSKRNFRDTASSTSISS